MATLQVKGIDDRLYEALRRRAEQDHRSISQEILSMIETFLSRPADQPLGNATSEFLALAGSWEDDRGAEEIVRDIRSGRRSRRRFNPDVA